MKKTCLIALLTIMIIFSFPITCFANMAAPEESDIGTAITFEKNDEIAVRSETLNITIVGDKAQIVAAYYMKNTLDEKVCTQSMFLSPNIEQNDVIVTSNGSTIDYTFETYALSYGSTIEIVDWQYVVLGSEDTNSNHNQSVDSITFDLTFEPNEERVIEVSYTYALGGYPSYDFDVKRGELEYYLTPANMWKDFENLTINLILDEDMPVITYSNLEFEQIGKYTYRYVSDTLPKENLIIHIDENWFQNIFSTLRSPYLSMSLMMFAPIIGVGLIVLVCIIVIINKIKNIK